MLLYDKRFLVLLRGETLLKLSSDCNGFFFLERIVSSLIEMEICLYSGQMTADNARTRYTLSRRSFFSVLFLPAGFCFPSGFHE